MDGSELSGSFFIQCTECALCWVLMQSPSDKGMVVSIPYFLHIWSQGAGLYSLHLSPHSLTDLLHLSSALFSFPPIQNPLLQLLFVFSWFGPVLYYVCDLIFLNFFPVLCLLLLLLGCNPTNHVSKGLPNGRQAWISSEHINMEVSHSEQCCCGRRMDHLNYLFQFLSVCAQGLCSQCVTGFSSWCKEYHQFCFWTYKHKGLLKTNFIQAEFELYRWYSWFPTSPLCRACSFSDITSPMLTKFPKCFVCTPLKVFNGVV